MCMENLNAMFFLMILFPSDVHSFDTFANERVAVGGIICNKDQIQ